METFLIIVAFIAVISSFSYTVFIAKWYYAELENIKDGKSWMALWYKANPTSITYSSKYYLKITLIW